LTYFTDPANSSRSRSRPALVRSSSPLALKARLKVLARKVLSRATEVAPAMDSHFAALEALLDEAEGLAQQIDESVADVSSSARAV
jgi:hypothetical protein